MNQLIEGFVLVSLAMIMGGYGLSMLAWGTTPERLIGAGVSALLFMLALIGGGPRTAGPGKVMGRPRKLKNPVSLRIRVEAEEAEQLRQLGPVSDMGREAIRRYLEAYNQ